MPASGFSTEYTHKSDDELLCLLTERNTLLPEAAAALDAEVRRRGLDKQDAEAAKKRIELPATREDEAVRNFVGTEEPEFIVPPRTYAFRHDIIDTIYYWRHKFRVWRTFREHTGHWPVLSIVFHFVSWLAVFAVAISAIAWEQSRPSATPWSGALLSVLVMAVLLVLRAVGAGLVRKADWRLFGEEKHRE